MRYIMTTEQWRSGNMYLLYKKQQNSMSKDKAFSDKWRVSFLILLHRQPDKKGER